MMNLDHQFCQKKNLDHQFKNISIVKINVLSFSRIGGISLEPTPIYIFTTYNILHINFWCPYHSGALGALLVA